MDLKFMLEALFDRPVDLATPRAIKPALKRRIESDLQRVS
jgi:predicted nucleotidyltransferase